MLKNAASAARKSVTDLALYPKPGTKLHGFTLVRAKHVPELELTALQLQHDKTGADYLHVARDDSNNVFSIGFKTRAPDNTGVPHILEHTTLCGSEKYPVRDPFFKMLPRSLSNFMNAMTASDYTFYPFATTNTQDFRNLMSVYLDATLHPLLKESDFFQEGWRIGPENPLAEDAEGRKLVFKGVVYNEMKGQMSDSDYLFYIRFQEAVFPHLRNSGGDPQNITDLTYEQLKSFHASNYHPSNAKLFTYGDMPLEDHLREVDGRLQAFNKLAVDSIVDKPLHRDGPRLISVPGPVDPLVPTDRQWKTSVSWMTGDTDDVLESFSLSLLSILLMDGYGSPLLSGFSKAGLGIHLTPNAGYDSSAKYGIFSVGLAGIARDDVEKVKATTEQILREVRQSGFDQGKIDGILHQLELALKHKTANFGYSMLNKLNPRWFNGSDPFDSLAWNDTISAFRAKLAEGNYLEGLMDKYLLNDETITFYMVPDELYGDQINGQEEERLRIEMLQAVERAGSEERARTVYEKQEQDLLAEQNMTSTEDLSCLPTIHAKDIPRSKEPVIVHDNLADGISIQWREAPTNGLTYFSAIQTMRDMPDDLRELIPVFSDCITRLGTKHMTLGQMEDLVKLKTGDLSMDYHVAPSPTDRHQVEEGFIFTGLALDRNVPALFDILQKLVRETDFDDPEATKTVRQVLHASSQSAVNEIASSGHRFAIGYSESSLVRSAWLRQQVFGLSQIKLLSKLAARPISDDLEDVISKLKRIQKLALTADNMRISITCGPESVGENMASVREFTGRLTRGAVETKTATLRPSPRNSKAFFPLPYQVYYGGLSLPTTSYTSPEGAPLQILAQLLTHKHLHHEIREKGGAYGAGAYSRDLDGVFGFFSYRDPNPQNTLAIARNAGQWAVDKKWTDQDLDEAKISVFKAIDAPRSVNHEGMAYFLDRITDEMKQRKREQLLDVTKTQVMEVAQKYLVNAMAKGEERMTFLGEEPTWIDGTWEVHNMDVKGN